MGGVKTNIFSFMNHMFKMLRFRDMRLFLFPIPSQEALLRARYASLRFASLRSQLILRVHTCILISNIRSSIPKKAANRPTSPQNKEKCIEYAPLSWEKLLLSIIIKCIIQQEMYSNTRIQKRGLGRSPPM